MIWIGTDSGLCKYLGDNKFYTYHNNYDSNSLLDDNVYSLMQDSTGLIWWEHRGQAYLIQIIK